MWPSRARTSTDGRSGRRVSWLTAAVAATTLVPVAGVALVGQSGSYAATRQATASASTQTGPALISRRVPASASSDRWEPASRANDDDYATQWRSAGVPAWLAYDLSSVPVERRGRVLAAWSNTSYGYSTRFGPHYNSLGSYTIQVNAAPGGGAAPVSGWTTKVTVTGNTLHSRQHVLDLAGANWVRLHVTASDGSTGNADAAVNSFDVYDLSAVTGPVPNSFVFYGDSITAGSMCPCPSEGVASLPELVQAARPGVWPVMENGGDPFTTSSDAVASILGSGGYLSLFPGSHVGLSYGMNDAAGGSGQELFYANMKQLVQGVLAAGKTPMIPTISYTADAGRNAVIPSYNAKITQLYAEFPQIVRGPDLWSFFSARRDLLAPGDIHPTAAGYAALRSQWAQTLLSTVYSGTPTAPAPVPSPTATAVPTTPPATPMVATGLRASGNRIVDASGKPVRLIGVNHSGTEYACVGGGGHTSTGYGVFEPADFGTNAAYLAAIKTWGSNTIRIGLNEACWLGINGVDPTFSGPAYQSSIRRFVDLATSSGLNVVLELHWSAPGTGPQFTPHGQAPMPSRQHTPTFWSSVAQSFKTNTAVAFDLFNEPHPNNNTDTPAAWQCWRDGSDPNDPLNTNRCAGTHWWDTNGNAFNGGKGYTYPVAGMQELVTAVRTTGATNLILLSGIQYANSLTGWRTHQPTDPANNLAASWHVYPFNTCNTTTCWNTTIAPVASTVPLVTAEIGDHNCATTFAPTVMTWLDQHQASYLAWTWNSWGCGGLQLMTDYLTGTPTTYGKPIADHFKRVTAVPVAPQPAPVPTTTTAPAPTTPAPAPTASPSPTTKGKKPRTAGAAPAVATTAATVKAAAAKAAAAKAAAAKAAAAKAAAQKAAAAKAAAPAAQEGGSEEGRRQRRRPPPEGRRQSSSSRAQGHASEPLSLVGWCPRERPPASAART